MIKQTVVMLLGAVAVSWACPKDSVEYEGTCAAMPAPAEVPQGDNPACVSDEKPSRHPEPAWERGEVHALMFPPVKESTGVATNYLAETQEK